MPRKQSRGRQQLAYQIARMMWEYGIEDFRLAKEKAMKQMGLRHAELPDNKEIARELSAYSALFASAEVGDYRQQLLEAASRLMRHLARFTPSAVGLGEEDVLTPNSGVHLHIFCDHPEVFDLYLQEMGVAYDLQDKRFRFGVEEYDYQPSYRFDFEGTEAEVTVFAETARSRVPLSPVGGQPMQRLKLAEVERLSH